jgi:hypothetical protein
MGAHCPLLGRVHSASHKVANNAGASSLWYQRRTQLRRRYGSVNIS